MAQMKLRLPLSGPQHYVLHILHNLGTATACQVGGLLYSTTSFCTNPRGAQRLLVKMEESGLVLRRRFMHSPHLWSLSSVGANAIGGKSGADQLKAAKGGWTHRRACNDLTVRLAHGGNEVWSDRAIQSSLAPIRRLVGKIPDVLAAPKPVPAEAQHVTWYEIERSRRGGRDLLQLTHWLADVMPQHGQPVEIWQSAVLVKVVIVLASPAAASLPHRLMQKLVQFYGRDEATRLLLSGRVEFCQLCEQDRGEPQPIAITSADFDQLPAQTHALSTPPWRKW